MRHQAGQLVLLRTDQKVLNTHFRSLMGLAVARGPDVYDRFARIVLSQVRDSAIFSGLPITEQLEPSCGVGVVNLVVGQATPLNLVAAPAMIA